MKPDRLYIQVDNALVCFTSAGQFLNIEIGECFRSTPIDADGYSYDQVTADLYPFEMVNTIANPEIAALTPADGRGWDTDECIRLSVSILENSTQGITVSRTGKAAARRARAIQPIDRSARRER